MITHLPLFCLGYHSRKCFAFYYVNESKMQMQSPSQVLVRYLAVMW